MLVEELGRTDSSIRVRRNRWSRTHCRRLPGSSAFSPIRTRRNSRNGPVHRAHILHCPSVLYPRCRQSRLGRTALPRNHSPGNTLTSVRRSLHDRFPLGTHGLLQLCSPGIVASHVGLSLQLNSPQMVICARWRLTTSQSRSARPPPPARTHHPDPPLLAGRDYSRRPLYRQQDSIWQYHRMLHSPR